MKFDRVQGLYTGMGAVLRLRDAAPGLTLRAAAGWAWNEKSARGRLVTEYRRGPLDSCSPPDSVRRMSVGTKFALRTRETSSFPSMTLIDTFFA